MLGVLVKCPTLGSTEISNSSFQPSSAVVEFNRYASLFCGHSKNEQLNSNGGGSGDIILIFRKPLWPGPSE